MAGIEAMGPLPPPTSSHTPEEGKGSTMIEMVANPSPVHTKGGGGAQQAAVLTSIVSAKSMAGSSLSLTSQNVKSFAWRDVSFYYPHKSSLTQRVAMRLKGKDPKAANGGEKPALQKITGYADAGTMTAVIGASGAGKSTLLDILARRFNKGRLEGQMLVNGKQISDDDFKEISGYVPQEDLFVVTQTAYEALMFVANLKMSAKTPKAEKERLIQELAGDAGLAHRLHVRIGGVIQGGLRLKGMSGGEKRRLALVACAITNPSIMFLDEPTSGLDSYAALKIIQKASDWATRGKIILCTIHQPRSQIWDLFDDVLILGGEGRQVYHGPVEGVPGWFKDLGYPVPVGSSVSDFVLDLLNNSFSPQHQIDKIEKSLRRAVSKGRAVDASSASHKISKLRRETSVHVNVQESADVFRSSELFNDIINDIEDSIRIGKEPGQQVVIKDKGSTKASWLYSFAILFKRNCLNYLRNPGNLASRVIMTTFVSVLTGSAYQNLTAGVNKLTALSLGKYTGFILVGLTLCCMVLTMLPFVSISLFIYDRVYFHRESRATLYSASAYFTAYVLLEMMVNSLTGCIFGVTQYFMQGLGRENGTDEFMPAHFFTYVAIVMTIANVGCMQSVMFSLVAPNQDVAFVCNTGYTTVCMLTAGQMVPYRMLIKNPFLNYLQWVTSMRYGWRALVINEFHGVIFKNIHNLQYLVHGAPQVVTGDWVLCHPMYGFQLCDLDLKKDAGLMVAVFAIMTSISFFALKYLNQD